MDTSWIKLWLDAFHSMSWREMSDVAHLVLYFLAVFAVFGCLLRLGTIRQIIKDFKEARGPLWDLRNTIDDLKKLEPVIREVGGQVALIDEKVEAARKQVAELQVESVSGRTDEAEVDEAIALKDSTTDTDENVDDRNWQQLRSCWRRNTQRIEYVIDRIEDGRTKVAYDRLSRRSYLPILDKLERQGFITTAAANASRSLIGRFNRYRPRNQKVPDEVVGGLAILDLQLDRELVPIAKVLAAEETGDKTPPPVLSEPVNLTSQTGQRRNGSTLSGASPA